MSGHARQTADKGIHSPYAWHFANAAARVAFTVTKGVPAVAGQLTADDIDREALQLDNNTTWRLTGIGPETWEQVGGGTPGLVIPQLTNGAVYESIDVTVTSNGTTITLNLQKTGGGDLTVQLSEALLTYTAGSISLTAGTDTAPVLNYVWIADVASTATLQTSTAGFPATEHAPIATVLCQSAASLQTDGAYKVHAWTDHLEDVNNQGHLSHINARLRAIHAAWISGVAPTLTIDSGPTPDAVDFACTVGSVYQLHPHTFPARDTASSDPMFVVNDSTTPFLKVTDLEDLLTDSLGGSLVGSYFSLVVWGVASEKTTDCKLMVNLPSGGYGNESELIADSDRYADFSIPEEFRGTGFLIAELQLRHQNAGGGTWTEVNTVDLRGLIPSTSPGGGGVVSSVFQDAAFRIVDDADNTKQVAFQVSSVSTATTRTLTVPDEDATLGGITSAAPANVTKAAAVVGSATTLARADHKHDVATAAPGTTGVATASGEGSSTSLARADHTHQSNTAPSNVTKATATIGTSGEPARADHKHDVTTATAGAAQAGASAAEGSATSLARSDHAHSVAVAAPATIGTTNDAGSSSDFVRADHVHAHGAQTSGTLHAAATTSVNGFMSAADKTKLNRLEDTELDEGNSGAGAKTINFDTNYNVRVTLTGDAAFALDSPSGPGHFQMKILTGAGSFNPTFSTTIRWAGGTAYTATTTASRADFINLYWDGSTWWGQYRLDFPTA